jgi:hypothetical protein
MTCTPHQNTIRVSKSWSMRQARHVARMGDRRGAQRILSRHPVLKKITILVLYNTVAF